MEGDRIDSIRSHTRGYTGAKTKDQREFFFFAEEQVNEANELIQNLIDTNFETMDPFLFTHFVRGNLFFLVDSLITSNFHIKEEHGATVDEKELHEIFALCNNYCQLYCKWLSLIPNLFGSVPKYVLTVNSTMNANLTQSSILSLLMVALLVQDLNLQRH